MKEYHVMFIKGGMTPKKLVENAQETLDEMSAQDWELKFVSGVLWIFEREN